MSQSETQLWALVVGLLVFAGLVALLFMARRLRERSGRGDGQAAAAEIPDPIFGGLEGVLRPAATAPRRCSALRCWRPPAAPGG